MSGTPLKWIDIPPIWLCVCLAVTYLVGQAQPPALSIDTGLIQIFGAGLVVAGLVLMLLAVIEMRRQHTTVIPHLEADHLVQSGIFKHTRNPIYLGDLLVLAGLILRWDALVALPLVAILGWVLHRRFIKPEETRLRRKFGPDFDHYTQTTRRWI